jgi:3-oxoadipate enol-lactonase
MTAVRVGYRVDGPADAPVVVLANSLGCDLRMWEQQASALAGRFRVVRYDHRGHGSSPTPGGPYTIDDLGSDAVRLLDDLGLGRVAFFGVSLGGMVGMWLAAHVPDRIERLAVCCTSASLGPPSRWRDRARAVREHGTGSVADAVVANWFTPGFAERHPDVVARMRGMIVATPDEGYAGCCEAIERMDLRPLLGKIVAPTVVIAGADDPATPPDHARTIVDGVAGAQLVVVDRAAHLANIEQAPRVTELITDHMAGMGTEAQ